MPSPPLRQNFNDTVAPGPGDLSAAEYNLNAARTDDAYDFAVAAYKPSGADVALADGGTGASLTDPNADRIMFWDDSAGATTWLTPGANLTITGTTIDAAGGGSGDVAATTHAAASKTTPADIDELPLVDSAASFTLKRLTWLSIKGTIKSYYDGVTTTMTNKTLTSPILTTPRIPAGSPTVGKVLTATDTSGNLSWSTAPYTNEWNVVNVKSAPYNAVGNGVADDTAAIQAAWAVNGAIYFPPGSYIYNGTGLDNAASNPIIIGAGGTQSTIILGATSYLLKPSVQLGLLELRDLNVMGGKGAFNHTYTGTNTTGTYNVTRMRFVDYTECAFATESSDFPYIFFNGCQFQGSSSTMGVALSPGLTDQCVFRDCAFNKNRVHVKAGKGGNNLHFENCGFIRFDTVNTAGPRIDIWFVPSTTSDNAGSGGGIRDCKFGNENLLSGDWRIVFADAGSGASNGTKFPALGADSTGTVRGLTISSCMFGGISDTPSPVYSTTPNVSELSFTHNQFPGAVGMDYIVQFRTVSTAPDWTNTRSVIGPLHGFTGFFDLIGPQASNDPGLGWTDDPSQILQTRKGIVRRHGSGSSPSFVELLSTAITGFSVSTCTITGTTDAYGGSDAATVNFTGDNAVTYGNISNLVLGMPCWVEIDVKQPADTPVSSVALSIRQGSPAAVHWGTIVEVPTTAFGWVTYAFVFTPRTTSAGAFPALFIKPPVSTGAGSTGKVILGRPRVYQSNERILGGRRPTVAAAATDPATTQALANDLRAKLIAFGLVKA